MSGEATFTLTPVDDGVAEGDEAITVSGSAVGLSVEPAELTLEDDDEASTSVELSVSPASVSEDGGAQQIAVTAALDGAARSEATPVTVTVGAAGDSAASGTDYQAVADFVLTIAPEALSGEAIFTLTPEDDGMAEGDEAITVSGSASGLSVEPAELTLEDDDEASTSVELSVSPAVVSEDGGAQQIAVTAALDGAARLEATSVTVTVGAAGDAAASGTDYQAVSDFVLTIPEGSASGEATFTLTPVDDEIAEGDEAITVRGTASGLSVEPAALTLEDDDEASTSVELSVSPAVVSEDGGAQQIAVTAALDGAARSEATPVTVSVGAAGDAAASGTDYQAVSDFVLTIAPGALSGEATFTLTPVDDGVTEGDEAITVSGSAVGLSVEPAELTLEDDDEASTSVELSVSPAVVSEDGGAQQIEVTAALDGAARSEATPVTVTVGAAGDAAVSGTDYQAASDFVLTIPEGFVSGEATFTLTPVDDEIAEGDEAITVHGSASGLTVNGAELTLNDDDTASTSVSLSVSPASASEDGGAQQIEVTAALAGAARSEATAVTVSVGAAGDSAASGTDYQAVPDFVLTIPEGSLSAKIFFQVVLVDDEIVEGDEAITVSGSASGLSVEPAELTLEDDDEASTSVTLSVSPASASEDGGAQQIEVTAALAGAARSEATAVTVSVGAAGDSAASGTDYQAVADFVLTIAPEALTGEATFTLTPADDEIAEGDEAITVHGTASGLTVNGAELTLNDDDTASTSVSLSVSPASASEDGGAQQIEVTAALAGAARSEATAVTVSVGAAGDSAASGTDYQAVADIALTIPAGSVSGEASFTLTPEDDGVAEGDERITVTGAASGLSVEPAELTLEDDDAASTSVDLSVSPGSVSEGSGATVVAVLVELMGAPAAEEIRFEIAVGESNDSATAGQDYEEVRRFVLSIPGGESRGSSRFVFTPLDDADSEGTESITIIATPVGVQLAPARATLDLNDNDEATEDIVVSSEIRVRDARASEGSGSMSFAVVLDSPAPAPIAVDWGTQPAASGLHFADEGADYRRAFGTLVIPSGNTTGRITVPLLDDRLDEHDEHFELLLYSASAGQIVDDVATGTIVDDDGPELRIADVRASESSGWLDFEVSLSAPSIQAITGRLATADATAFGGEDYKSVDASFRISPGRQHRVVQVQILDDSLDEDDETLVLSVADVRNARVVKGDAEGTIEDDDASPTLLTADSSAAEGDGELVFLVRLAARSGRVVTVDYRTSDADAREGEDFEGVSGTIEFTPGELSKRIAVPVLDDDLDEVDEKFHLLLSAPTNAVLEIPQAVGTIKDDDAEPTLRVEDATASESAGMIEFGATLDAPAGRDLIYLCWTTDGEAHAGQDYEEQQVEWVIPAGATTAVAAVSLIDDALDETEETFTVSFANPREPGNAAVTAVGTIEDDDENAPVMRMWITRFGRSAATQLIESVEERMDAGSRATRFSLGGDPMQTLFQVAARDTRGESWSDLRARANGLFGVDGGEMLGRSSFLIQQASESSGRPGSWAVWGRGTTLRFSGEDDGINMRGDVLTATIGADYRRGRMLAGFALANSIGNGPFTVAGSNGNGSAREGRAHGRIATLSPYLSVPLNERISVWGLGGYGIGTVSLAAEDADSDLSMLLGALGVRADLRPGTRRLRVAVKADMFWARMDAGATAVRLASTGVASRGRILTEGSWRLGSLWGGEITPILEAGVRYDGGDAETGLGLEFGSGVRYERPASGLSVELNGRTLVAHQDTAYREWGIGGKVSLDSGMDRRGPSLTIASSLGDALSGVNRMWKGRDRLAERTRFAPHGGGQLEAEFAYGFGSLAGGPVTPFAGVSWQEQGNRVLRLGSRLDLGSSLQLSLEGSRRESYYALPDHSFVIRGHLR